ncbi:MAG: caspase family protein [Crocinitomicaceae bacterium]
MGYKLVLFIISVAIFSPITAYAQQEELVVHRSHSSDIELLEFSKSSKLLASLGENSEVIIWNTKLGRLLTTFYISEVETVQSMCFSENEDTLYVRTQYTVFAYDIVNSKLRNIGQKKLRRNRTKTYYYDAEKNTELIVKKGTVQKRIKGKKIPIYRCSGNSLDSKLNAFDVNPNKKSLIAAGDDGKIYLYNYSLGVGSIRYSGHFSAVKDVVFTEDGKFFASAGKDRSIIIWNAETFEIERTIYSSIFRKNTVEYSKDGSLIYVGDELGFVYSININSNFPEVNAKKLSKNSINNISYYDRSESFFISTSDDNLYEKVDPFSDNNKHTYRFSQYPIKHTKSILLGKLGAYQQPYGEIQSFAKSESGKKIAFTGTGYNPSISVYDRENNKMTRLYKPKNTDNFGNVFFLNESTLISQSQHDNILHLWQWQNKDIFYRTDTFAYQIEDFIKLNESEIWITTKNNGQFIYNVSSRYMRQPLKKSGTKVFKHKNYAILVDLSHSIIFYNLQTKKIEYTFRGHSDLVTDIAFNPVNNTFVSSSFDGSIKLWDFSKKDLISTIIPFKNQDFIIINNDNYYLVSKGAIDDFGFRYKNNYFYPDLFDIKYNRPDLVLKSLNSRNSELISAYHQAYLRRLKKLNYTEDKLKVDFNLPTVEIKNLVKLKPKTENDFIELLVEASDKKYQLEKLNVYLNGVALYGVNGYDISAEKTFLFEKRLKIPLTSGKNKIEISAQNEKGVESFKQTYKVENTNPSEGSNLYLVSIGVSKYENAKYNLNYAAKDAKDMAKAFRENKSFNNVYSRVFTDKEVTKDNLKDVKTFLKQAKINDMVIVFVAGHGVLDEDFNYYFAAHDMDFLNPILKGIPYEMIENLVDNIKALRKLLFIDTCHSGEVEKDEVEKDNTLKEIEKGSDVIFRSAGNVDIKQKDNKLGLQSTNQLMKSLFTDLRKGTGATVISSSGGTEYAQESDSWQNGLFTYCLLKGLTEKEADSNKDKKISISELQNYIQTEVNSISNGTQTPTSRFVNTQLDYRIW